MLDQATKMKGLEVEVSLCGKSQKKIDQKKRRKRSKKKNEDKRERERKRDIGSARETGRFSGNSIALLRVLCATYSGERIMAVSCADFQPLLEMKNPGTRR